MTLWRISAKNNWNWGTGKQLVNKYKSKQRAFKALCLLIISQSVMLLILNLIPIGGEWATACREWIGNTIGLN